MNKHERPYVGEHSARIKDPKQYDKFRRKNNEFGDGIHVIYGIKTEEDKSEVQSIRFDSSKFTVSEAKKWLKDHNWKYIKFEPASDSKEVKTFFGLLVRERRPFIDSR